MRNCVPAGWGAATLDELAGIVRGVTFPSSAKLAVPTDNSVICLRTSNVQRQLEFGDVLHISQTYVKREEQWLQDGDTVISMANSYELVGKVAYAKSPPPRTTIGGFISIVRSRGIDPRFLYYQLASTDVQEEMRKTASTTVNISNLSLRGIRPLPLVVAPLPEQHRIVEAIESYLTRLDDAVASLERVQRNLERYRASVLKAAVEGRLVPTEADLARQEGRTYEPADVLLERILAERKTRWIEDAAEKARSKAEAKARKADKPWTPEDDAKALEKAHKAAETKYKEPAAPDLSASGAQAGTTDLPEGWCWATADQLAYRVTDGEHQTPTRTESGIPLVSARNVLNGQLSFADVDFVSRETHLELCKRLAVAAGDVLLSCSGTVGRACVVPPGVEFSMVRSAAVLMPALPIGPYMEFGLRSPMLQEQIRRRKTETAQANIFQGKIKQLVFPLPPFAEQEHITTRTGEYFAIAEHIEKGIKIAMAKCLRLRQSILKWAFEGKLVEQDPDDEPASVLLKRIQSEIPRVKR